MDKKYKGILCREVWCPYCEKKFMVFAECNAGIYDMETHKSVADVTKCTSCGTELAYYRGKLEGIDIDDLLRDERYRKAPILT